MSKIASWWFYFVHELLGWHKPMGATTTMWCDGLNTYSRCRCGKMICRDSQGNWFSLGD